MSYQVQNPDRNFVRQQRYQIIVGRKYLIRIHVAPITGRSIAIIHQYFLQSGDGSLKRHSVAASKSKNIIELKDWDKDMKFSSIEEFIDGEFEQKRVYRSIGRRDSDQKRNGLIV